MKLVSGIVDSGFFAQSALSAEVATKDSLGRNISETYLTAVDIPESAVWNATTQTVSANSAQWAGGTANPQIPVTGINGIKISESGDKVVFEVSADYALADDLTGKQDSLSFGYKDTAISSIDNSALYDNSAHARITTLAGRISDLSSNKLDTTAFSTVSGDFLTAVDLTPYQEKADMTAYATVESLTAKQDAGDYLSASDSANFLLTSDSGNFYTTANESGFITGVDLTPYMLTADMTGYQVAGSYLSSTDSANFYTTANESGFISEVPAGTMNESAFGYDANDKISGYNGSAFAGGSDVPEGVMVESGLEYNAVNEISAYNGSAIAQYGAEKQFIVHDDTLVHAANSAQYALGVNLSAVAQLLGVDETVLFSASTGTQGNVTLSEPYTSFKRFKVEYSIGHTNDQSTIQYDYGSKIIEFNSDNIAHSTKFSLSDMMPNGTGAGGLTSNVIRRKDMSAKTDEFVVIDSYQLYWNGSTWSQNANNQVSIMGVTGIGRKQ